MYLYAKSLHIIAVISWMAGILYLYRLFIYHVERGFTLEGLHELFTLMEKRLYKYITIPAMCVAILAGCAMLILNPGLLQQNWMISKLVCVLFLIASTLFAGAIHSRLRDRQEPLPSSKKLRILNEVPTLLMIAIVVLVVFKSF